MIQIFLGLRITPKAMGDGQMGTDPDQDLSVRIPSTVTFQCIDW